MIKEKIFIKAWGSNPWPNFDINSHLSFLSSEQKELYELIENLIDLSGEWLYSTGSIIVFDSKAKLDLITTIKKNVPVFQDFMIDKIIQYVGWLGWHEGLIQVTN